jgi:hypothetical protein
MAYYALLDKNNVVVQVIAGKDEDEGIYDWEVFYAAETRLKCRRTSFNTVGGLHTQGKEPFRKNFAAIGFVYDESRDAFIPPKPFDSWCLNDQTCLWEPPVPMPSDGIHKWDEQTQTWIRVSE